MQRKKTNKLIKLFLKYDIEVYSVNTLPYSDVGEMTHKEFIARKDCADVLTLDNYLLNRIREYLIMGKSVKEIIEEAIYIATLTGVRP